MLDKIRHQDGANVLQSFEYTYDDAYQITGIEHADGSNWAYEYDNRYRLTKATRNNQLIVPGIKAVYDYAYDAGDNMTSKTVPVVYLVIISIYSYQLSQIESCPPLRPQSVGRVQLVSSRPDQ